MSEDIKKRRAMLALAHSDAFQAGYDTAREELLLAASAATDDEVKRWHLLSPRERQVALLIVEGKRTKEIGRLLDISPRTVEVHRAKLYEKLETSSLVEAAVLVFKFQVRRELQGGYL